MLINNIFVKNIYKYSVYVKTILILKFYGTFFKSVTVSGNYHADIVSAKSTTMLTPCQHNQRLSGHTFFANIFAKNGAQVEHLIKNMPKILSH